MKVGINIYGSNSLSDRTFQSAIIGFVQVVREKHPETPFVVISPIFSSFRENTRNAVGFTLEGMRHEVEEAVLAMRRQGDVRICIMSAGLRYLGLTLGHLLFDDLHPGCRGVQDYGQELSG